MLDLLSRRRSSRPLLLLLWLTLSLCLLLLLLLAHKLLSSLFLLHLDKLLRGHARFGGLGFDLLALECLELWNSHASFLCLHGDQLLDLLLVEGSAAWRGSAW
jgi:hypothetical protein